MVEALRSGLQALASEPAATGVRAPLLITGFVHTSWADYQICLDWQAEAFAAGLQAL